MSREVETPPEKTSPCYCGGTLVWVLQKIKVHGYGEYKKARWQLVNCFPNYKAKGIEVGDGCE